MLDWVLATDLLVNAILGEAAQFYLDFGQKKTDN
jgi:hypothetical protein